LTRSAVSAFFTHRYVLCQLSSILHRHGIPVRYLGILRQLVLGSSVSANHGHQHQQRHRHEQKNDDKATTATATTAAAATAATTNAQITSVVVLAELTFRTMKHHLRQLLRETIRDVSVGGRFVVLVVWWWWFVYLGGSFVNLAGSFVLFVYGVRLWHCDGGVVCGC
jgi:hypothetical protein